jgi:hypothetical protein
MEIMNRTLLNASLHNDFASFAERSFQTVNPGTEFLSNWHHLKMRAHMRKGLWPRERSRVMK